MFKVWDILYIRATFRLFPNEGRIGRSPPLAANCLIPPSPPPLVDSTTKVLSLPVFSYQRDEGSPTVLAENMHIPQPGKIPPIDFPLTKSLVPQPKSYPLTHTKQLFLCYNLIKTSFLAIIITLAPILF